MQILPSGLTVVPIEVAKVRGICNQILLNLSNQDIDVGTGAGGCGMVIGRLMSPHRMSGEEEMAFLQSLLEWVGCYWPDGGTN